MAEGDVCCCGARSWAKVIGRIQILLNGIGFILFSVVLAGLLELGQEGFDNDGKDGRVPEIPESISNMTYSACISVLIVSLGVFFIGALFGYFLLKGTFENKPIFLKWWIFYACICSTWSMFYTALDPDTLKVVSMITSAAMYGFGIYVVSTLIREIETDRKLMKERITCKSKLLRENQPLTYKYTLLV